MRLRQWTKTPWLYSDERANRRRDNAGWKWELEENSSGKKTLRGDGTRRGVDSREGNTHQHLLQDEISKYSDLADGTDRIPRAICNSESFQQTPSNHWLEHIDRRALQLKIRARVPLNEPKSDSWAGTANHTNIDKKSRKTNPRHNKSTKTRNPCKLDSKISIL